MDVGNIALGPEGLADLKLEGGMLILTFVHKHASGEVTITVKENAKYFLEKLKVAIPGKLDDVVIDVIEGALP